MYKNSQLHTTKNLKPQRVVYGITKMV